jgi:pimeloyl-ACP methyl ester carboxylesterase
MATDYADLIDANFGGVVDLVVGISYGGLIAQALAGGRPGRCRRLVIALAGSSVSQEAMRTDLSYARALARGDTSGAGLIVVQGVLPDWTPRFLTQLSAKAVGEVIRRSGHEWLGGDVLIEAQAESGFDARGLLHQIATPTLLVAGDRDRGFPRQVLAQTAGLIPDCTLRLYRGRNHLGAYLDRRLGTDILAFARNDAQVLIGTPPSSPSARASGQG